jgi:hypothetical protein
MYFGKYTRWFKYDRDDLCVNKSQFVPVIFEPPCMSVFQMNVLQGPSLEMDTLCASYVSVLTCQIAQCHLSEDIKAMVMSNFIQT